MVTRASKIQKSLVAFYSPRFLRDRSKQKKATFYPQKKGIRGDGSLKVDKQKSGGGGVPAGVNNKMVINDNYNFKKC